LRLSIASTVLETAISSYLEYYESPQAASGSVEPALLPFITMNPRGRLPALTLVFTFIFSLLVEVAPVSPGLPYLKASGVPVYRAQKRRHFVAVPGPTSATVVFVAETTFFRRRIC